MQGLVETTKKLKAMGNQKVLALNTCKSMSNLNTPTVVGVFSASLRSLSYREYVLMKANQLQADGGWECIHLMAPPDFKAKTSTHGISGDKEYERQAGERGLS